MIANVKTIDIATDSAPMPKVTRVESHRGCPSAVSIVTGEPYCSSDVRVTTAVVVRYLLFYRVFMSTDRVLAPEQPTDGSKLKGPASYFPSIEKTYGKPIQEWLDLVSAQLADNAHMQVVSMLKADHGLGHGHANAIVAYVKAAQK